jgi:hypothetical protein
MRRSRAFARLAVVAWIAPALVGCQAIGVANDRDHVASVERAFMTELAAIATMHATGRLASTDMQHLAPIVREANGAIDAAHLAIAYRLPVAAQLESIQANLRVLAAIRDRAGGA